MSWETFDINVLVNGNRCKKYDHDGRTYIEAKDGSEYSISIQNNTPNRVLAICSVDGLNVLTGEKASIEDSGYIIDAYHTQKIKGFRFSDTEWAMFKFGYKLNGKTYAQSKNDGSEKNCGIVGVRLFNEKVKPATYVTHFSTPITLYPMSPSPNWTNKPYDKLMCGSSEQSSAVQYSANLMKCQPEKEQDLHAYHGNVKTDFDIGTEWGRREESKVVEVDFERGGLIFSTDIFYASRQSLINSGVPLIKKLKVSSLPQSFPENKYAKPPKNWRG